MTQAEAGAQYALLRPFFFGGPVDSASEYWVRWVKLEEGNIPTKWSPAPEDTQIDIGNAVASTVKTTTMYYAATDSRAESPNVENDSI